MLIVLIGGKLELYTTCPGHPFPTGFLFLPSGIFVLNKK